jgi:pyruvate/2-oxoacid:ferredoxin oxidoreductase beta subunit
MMAIMVVHCVACAATISVAHPDDAVRKFRHARSVEGFRFFPILSPCPTG